MAGESDTSRTVECTLYLQFDMQDFLLLLKLVVCLGNDLKTFDCIPNSLNGMTFI